MQSPENTLIGYQYDQISEGPNENRPYPGPKYAFSKAG